MEYINNEMTSFYNALPLWPFGSRTAAHFWNTKFARPAFKHCIHIKGL